MCPMEKSTYPLGGCWGVFVGFIYQSSDSSRMGLGLGFWIISQFGLESDEASVRVGRLLPTWPALDGARRWAGTRGGSVCFVFV